MRPYNHSKYLTDSEVCLNDVFSLFWMPVVVRLYTDL